MDFKGGKNPQHAFLRREIKLEAAHIVRDLRNVKELYVGGKTYMDSLSSEG
jgi:hypothetical protein